METGDGTLLIERALDFDPKASLDRVYTENRGVLTIRFAGGSMRAVGKRL
jgi:hypothetical protein